MHDSGETWEHTPGGGNGGGKKKHDATKMIVDDNKLLSKGDKRPKQADSQQNELTASFGLGYNRSQMPTYQPISVPDRPKVRINRGGNVL